MRARAMPERADPTPAGSLRTGTRRQTSHKLPGWWAGPVEAELA